MATSFDELIANLEKERQAANVANQKRYQQMQAIFDEIVTRYTPGGAFEKKFEQQLGTRKQQEVGRAKQDLISSGLFGTERLAGTERQWEQEVGEPARLSAQDLMMQRLSAAQLGKAESIERVSDTGPDYATIAALAMQAGEKGGININMPRDPYESNSWGLTSLPGRAAPTIQPATPSAAAKAETKEETTGGAGGVTMAPFTAEEQAKVRTQNATPGGLGLAGKVAEMLTPVVSQGTSAAGKNMERQYYIPGYNNNMPVSESEHKLLSAKWKAAGGQSTGKTLGQWLSKPTKANVGSWNPYLK